MKYGYEYKNLENIPTFYTIHNAAYYGAFDWHHYETLPAFESRFAGFLDWDGVIHSMASAVRCASMVNTVSPNYMEEITYQPGSLAYLFAGERHKCIGILNGIDNEEWDPKTDPLLSTKWTKSWDNFKKQSKGNFAEKYGLNPKKAWFSFIGRFTEQKGVDTLAPAIRAVLSQDNDACFIILGSGDKSLEFEIEHLETPGIVKTFIMYNEALAHEIYASSDFIVMPSRFEPCGLNQMFAMRYGTVPVVRATGGLKDTVHESEKDGTGFTYNQNNSYDFAKAMLRALESYKNKQEFKKLRTRCTRKDFSWENSAKEYASQYKKLM